MHFGQIENGLKLTDALFINSRKHEVVRDSNFQLCLSAIYRVT